MPQAADAGNPDGLTTTPEEAAAGAINYLEPVAADVQKEGVVAERWQQKSAVAKKTAAAQVRSAGAAANLCCYG